MKNFLFLFSASLILYLASPVLAKNIYVDQTLDSAITNGSYSIEHRNQYGEDGDAYLNIQQAINQMNGGDDIYLRGGIYYENNIYIPSEKTGTEENWSSIQSYPGEWAKIDGMRQCGTDVPWDTHSVIRNGGFSHQEPDGPFAQYWIFQRLEITGGGLAGVVEGTASGIWWNKGPVIVRYCYIHDNLADNQNENPAGFNGCSQHDILIEYCWFQNNGSLNHEHNNSRNICLTGTSEYADLENKFDTNWYLANNEIRYNLIETHGGVGIATKSYQWLTPARDGSDFSFKNWGDKIHHNIVLGSNIYGIAWQQDFCQIYKNIIKMGPSAGEESWGIMTRRVRTDNVDTLANAVYNNTIIDSHAGAIFDGYEAQDNTPAVWWCLNNIITNHTDDWDRDEISIGTELYTLDAQDITIDRNYFYDCTSDDHMIKIGETRFTLDDFLDTYPEAQTWQNNISTEDPLFMGVASSEQFITRGEHMLDHDSMISNSGINTDHPYYSTLRLPSFIGATNPDDYAWVEGVLNLSSTDTEGVPVELLSSQSHDPEWVETEFNSDFDNDSDVDGVDILLYAQNFQKFDAFLNQFADHMGRL